MVLSPIAYYLDITFVISTEGKGLVDRLIWEDFSLRSK